MSSLLIILALSFCAFPFNARAAGPAVFIFGDSIVDVGTNNYINSIFKVNHSPYGIDYRGRRPTGRYSNGFNSADQLVKKFGFVKSPQPFFAIANVSARTNVQIMRGVNFASGGSGLLDATGSGRGVIPMSQQIKQFGEVRARLTKLLGAGRAGSLVRRSFFFISTGGNDLFQQFFANGNAAPSAEYITSLTNAYESHIRVLYSLEARKFAISSVPALGCIPLLRVSSANGACSDELNSGAESFYSAIGPVLRRLSSELSGMKYSLGNTYKMNDKIFGNPSSGLTELRSACCGEGKFNAQEQCNRGVAVCANRDKYLYWDQYHPTQAAAALAADTLYSGTTEFMMPINFKQLFEAS